MQWASQACESDEEARMSAQVSSVYMTFTKAPFPGTGFPLLLPGNSTFLIHSGGWTREAWAALELGFKSVSHGGIMDWHVERVPEGWAGGLAAPTQLLLERLCFYLLYGWDSTLDFGEEIILGTFKKFEIYRLRH